MAKTVLVEEFHLTVSAPGGLRDAEYRAMARALRGANLLARLRRAAQEALRPNPSLAKVRLTLSR